MRLLRETAIVRILFAVIVPAPCLSAGNYSAAQGAEPPVVGNLPSAYPPAIPSDLKVTCLTNPNSLQSSTTCPVIMWNE
jgi:hypothetical protein